jgi:tetratricopeptide (TPR) repeat protein
LDKENDIAILKANANNLPVVKLGDLEKTGIGEKIYVISSPKGLENTLSDGILSGKREIAPNRIILQITAPISSESSGGPVFNKNGQVIGVATFLLKESQNLNFAMPVDVIKNKITGKKVAAIKESQIEDCEKTTVYWFNLGVAYYSSGLYREALESYKQAIRIEPDFAEAHYNLGHTYRELGMTEEAIAAFKQAIRIKPDFVEAHSALGLAYLSLNDRSGALGEYNILKNLNPQLADKLFNLIYKR